MRAKSFLLFGIFLCLLSSDLHAQVPRQDGHWWDRMTAASKPTYVSGLSQGMLLGRDLICFMLQEKSNDSDEASRFVYNAYAEAEMRFLKNLQVEDIVRQLNTFYFNPRNKGILVNDAIHLLILQNAGVPGKVLDKLLEQYRLNSKKR